MKYINFDTDLKLLVLLIMVFELRCLHIVVVSFEP